MRDSDTNDGVESFSMPLGEHVEELRRRVLRSLILVGVAFIGAFAAREAIMAVLQRPHTLTMEALQLAPSLKFASYPEGFIARLKACLAVSFAACSPYVFYQMWAFITPGLYRRERRVVLRAIGASVVCFAAAALFGYFLFIPLALRFMLAMSGADTEPVIMIGSYLSLLLLLTLALGLAFQMPLIVYHLVKWKIVSVEQIQRHRKAVILAGFVLAAFLTPPDPLTQIMLAVPLIVLYDLGTLAAAPTRRTFGNFARFAGIVALVGAVVAALLFLWPVGRVTALRGGVEVGGRLLRAGQSASLRRGQVCVVKEGGAARVSFGRGRSASLLLLAEGARAQVHGSRQVSVYAGNAFGDNSQGGSPLEVRTAVARAVLEAGKAEFGVPEPLTLTVKVAAGEVVVRRQGLSTRIPAGRSATFQEGGEPLQDAGFAEPWERLLDGAGGRPE